MGIQQLLFSAILLLGIGFFAFNFKRLMRNIRQGKPLGAIERKKERTLAMIRLALGQQKMQRNVLVGVLHLVIYLGFLIINIELIEIIIDGVFGTHRALSFLGAGYDLAIALFELFALAVIVSVVVFWVRRNMMHIKRFMSAELKGWPKLDANLILIIELVLMFLFLGMNAADYALQLRGVAHYSSAGAFPISEWVAPVFNNWPEAKVIAFERGMWWAHIIGILGFLNYLYYSKHLHILLAFPNTFYASLEPKGKFENNAIVTREVKAMLTMEAEDSNQEIERFGAKDVTDLTWVQLMNAYSCTECGRCTAACPANQTGKLLSPRKIMMDTRDRATEISTSKGLKDLAENTLLDHYISREELWACTSCNACVEACPIGIDPLSIIMKMRQYIVMEESTAPGDLNAMMTNIENNGAPWAFNAQDRLNWVSD
ncbi:MAG: (Fe-S)-binding protein [Flavobacteriaceae bacterium]